MSDKNWAYKSGFSFYALGPYAERLEELSLHEFLEEQSSAVDWCESLFPLVLSAGVPVDEDCCKLADSSARFLAERYREDYGHPSDSSLNGWFWDELENYGLTEKIRTATHDKEEQAVLDALVALEAALKNVTIRSLDVEEIEITLEEIKQHAPHLLGGGE